MAESKRSELEKAFEVFGDTPLLEPFPSSERSIRKETTESLSKALEAFLDPKDDPRVYWAKEVTVDYATDHRIRVDYMLFKPVNNTVSGIEKGDFSCFEVKSSVEDYRSPNGHNFIGDYNYYVMPYDVFEVVKAEIPRKVGVYCLEGNSLKSVKRAIRTDRTHPVSELLLMMFRSAMRENRKQMNRKRDKKGEPL